MKIKTSSTLKTAPSPPPTPVDAPTPYVPPKKRGCCATWSCCDVVLLVLLLVGVAGALLGATLMRAYHHRKGDDHHYYHRPAPQYKPASCRVKDIVSQGDVCCAGEMGENCEAGMRGNLNGVTWFKFKDEATNDRASMNRMEEWEEMEREELEELQEEFGEPEFDMDEDSSEHDRRDPDDRMKRSYQSSFACYKIVLEGWDSNDVYEFGDEGRWSSEESTSEEESSEEDGHRSHPEGESSEEEGHWGHHGSHRGGHHGGHHGGKGGHHRPGHHSRERRDDWEERRRMHMEGHKSEEWMEESHEGTDATDTGFEPEAGITVWDGEQPVDEVYTAVFYDSSYTMQNYLQCSYSACNGRRCKSTGDIEEKMQKWRARLESKEEFDCSVLDPNEERRWKMMPEPESKNEWRKCFRYAKLVILPYAAVMLILFILLVVRRCRAAKLRNQQRRSAQASAPTKYAVPDSEAQAEPKLTKEQEANLPPSAPPATVWTANLPSHEKESELPPVYQSTPDLKQVVAWTIVEEEVKEKPKEEPKEETDA